MSHLAAGGFCFEADEKEKESSPVILLSSCAVFVKSILLLLFGFYLAGCANPTVPLHPTELGEDSLLCAFLNQSTSSLK